MVSVTDFVFPDEDVTLVEHLAVAPGARTFVVAAAKVITVNLPCYQYLRAVCVPNREGRDRPAPVICSSAFACLFAFAFAFAFALLLLGVILAPNVPLLLGGFTS